MSFVTVSRNRNKAFVQTVLSQDASEIAAQEAEIARRVRQELAKLRGQVEAEARSGAEAAAEVALAPRLAALESAMASVQAASAQLLAPLGQKEQDLAELSIELAFVLARHIGGGGDAAQGNLHSLVTKLLDEAAAERGPRQALRVHVHSVDFTELCAKISRDAVQFLADDKIAPGGAMVEIMTPDGDPVDKIEWDATLPGRFGTVRAALGLHGEGI